MNEQVSESVIATARLKVEGEDNDCPSCGKPARVKAMEDRVELECTDCGVDVPAMPIRIGGRWLNSGVVVRIPKMWTRPLSDREEMEQRIRRIDEIEKANRHRRQKLPQDQQRFRAQLREQVERLR